MVAKRGKKPGKKVKSLSVKSMSARKAKGVRGGARTVKQTSADFQKWIELSPSFGQKVT